MYITDILVFATAVFALWKASNLVVAGVDGFSKDAKISSFVTSFIILGVLTSLTEISVGLNSLALREPQIFAGNLIGGSFVILAFVIPVLAIANKGLKLDAYLAPKRTLAFVGLLISPCLVLLDGTASVSDAAILIALYVLFVNSFRGKKQAAEKTAARKPLKSFAKDAAKIAAGAAVIYLASVVLVEDTSIFAHALGIPPILVSLLVLSIGTNLPELSLALSSVRKNHAEIAFGDYVGSAAFNVFLFGAFTLMHGPFSVPPMSLLPLTFVIALGYAAFFFLARSSGKITPSEAAGLIALYVLFLALQVANIASIS